jgi:hypothetical protein
MKVVIAIYKSYEDNDDEIQIEDIKNELPDDIYVENENFERTQILIATTSAMVVADGIHVVMCIK